MGKRKRIRRNRMARSTRRSAKVKEKRMNN
jgi:hypothetical protein